MNDNPLLHAIEHNQPHEVARLILQYDPVWIVNIPVLHAVRYNSVACLEVLVSKYPRAQYHVAFHFAAQCGNLECAKLLSSYVSVGYFPRALEISAGRGHTQTVGFFLPHVSNITNINTALKNAVLNQHHACVNILYPLAQVGEVVGLLHQYFSDQYDQWKFLEDQYNAEQQKNVLHCAIGLDQHTSARFSKM